MICGFTNFFPNFTKPILNLRDQNFFSSTCLNKLDEINKEYQKQVCSLLGAHHTEMAEQSRLFLDICFRDIDSIYNNSTFRKRLDRLSKDLSIDAYNELLTKSKRNRGQKRPHPKSISFTIFSRFTIHIYRFSDDFVYFKHLFSSDQ